MKTGVAISKSQRVKARKPPQKIGLLLGGPVQTATSSVELRVDIPVADSMEAAQEGVRRLQSNDKIMPKSLLISVAMCSTMQTLL